MSLICDSLYYSLHYSDVIIRVMSSQITSLTIIYSTVYPGADQRKYQSSSSLAFVRGIHRGPGNSPHKRPVTRIMFPFDDISMSLCPSLTVSPTHPLCRRVIPSLFFTSSVSFTALFHGYCTCIYKGISVVITRNLLERFLIDKHLLYNQNWF